jgi:hypothetical protein
VDVGLPRVAAIAVVLCVVALDAAPRSAVQELAPATSASGLEILRIRPNFYMIAGAGGNIAVQVGVDGVVLVDTGSRANVEDVMTAVRKIASTPIRFIINTSADADQVGGNERLQQAGQASFDAIANLFPRNYLVSGAVAILASEAVLRRMTAPTGEVSPFPVSAWPTETFETGRRTICLGEASSGLRSAPGTTSCRSTSGWTAARIRRRWPSTRAAASPPATGMG